MRRHDALPIFCRRMIAPTCTSLPLALAANITHKEKYVGDQTCGVEACWSVAGGYAPRRKCPIRPLATVGEGISRPPVLTPVPKVSPSALSAGVSALAHSSGRARGGVGQVLGATASPLDWLSDQSARWTTNRRTYTKPPVGVFSLPFLPSR